MKKLFYSLICAAIFGFSAMAQEITVTMVDNSEWNNSQGFTAITPSKDILKGDEVTVSLSGTVDAPDASVSVLIIDTVAVLDEFGDIESQWREVSSWGNSATVKDGKISGEFSFTAPFDVIKPVICCAVMDGYESYIDKILTLNVACTAETPKAPEPGDILEVKLSEIQSIWDECGNYNFNKETNELTLCPWSAGAGWAKWFWSLTASSEAFPSADFQSFTVEFAEPLPCQIGLVVQVDDGTESGENNQVFVEAGETKATLDFEDFVGTPDINGMWLQFSETQTITLSKAYFTYKGAESAVNEVAKVEVANGIVYSAGYIAVYNENGQLIASANAEFNLNALPNGIYLVQTLEGAIKYFKN